MALNRIIGFTFCIFNIPCYKMFLFSLQDLSQMQMVHQIMSIVFLRVENSLWAFEVLILCHASPTNLFLESTA